MTAIDRQAPKGATTDEGRLDLLRRIAAAGGTIRPNAEPEAQRGYEYFALGDADEKDLSYLAQRDYLEARFFDRVSLCPKCTSHHLNVREICPGCRRAHLANEGLLHHFRCGYVGILSEFTTGKDGSRVCPKCNHKLHHLGTEYDRFGKTFVCRECGVISENPPVEAVCLACGARTPAEDLVNADVFSYVLTSLGSAAIRRGSLADNANEFFVDGAPVYRPAVILEFLHHEAKRLGRFETGFSVLLAEYSLEAVDDGEDSFLAPWLVRLRRCLREVDLLGQLADAAFVVILPRTNEHGAEALRQRIMAELGPQLPLTLSAIEITEPRHLAQVVARRGGTLETA